VALVTLVIPVRGTLGLVVPLLDALEPQAKDADTTVRVVVVDDANGVPLAADLEERAYRHLTLDVVRREANGGPGASRNTGFDLVDTPWVAFLDADVVPAPDWLERLTAIVGADDPPDVIEGRMAVGGDEPATPFAHATEAVPPEQRVAANLIFRSEVLRAAGGFDERFYDPGRRVHFREDAELAFRLEAEGRRFAYEPDLLVVHPPLPPSFWTPVKLARRYYFDPLLSREHPEAFRALNRSRMVGPITLRRARHDAAVLFVGGAGATAVGLLARKATLARIGLAALVVGWLANIAALAWRKEVRPRDVVPVAAVATLVPWTYLASYWRGVVHFRHRPRL
jgi:GT2 family glycosyltransferase